jgi:hypothetical protein
MLTGFARAGADIIITYFAKDYARSGMRSADAASACLAGGEATRLPGKLALDAATAAAGARVSQRRRDARRGSRAKARRRRSTALDAPLGRRPLAAARPARRVCSRR